jgi:hypothetical protein
MYLDFFQSYVGVMHKLFFYTCWDWPQIVVAWCWCISIFVVWVIREIDKLGTLNPMPIKFYETYGAFRTYKASTLLVGPSRT